MGASLDTSGPRSRYPSRMVLILATICMATVVAAGAAMAAVIDGNDNPNNITGTGERDVIRGYGDNDLIQGLAGNDDIYGGDGPDRLYAVGIDLIRQGSDLLSGGNGTDTLNGGPGADTLSGGPDADDVTDGPTNDASVDTITGGDGNDTIGSVNTPSARDNISCGTGFDSVGGDDLDVIAADCEVVGLTARGTDGDDALQGRNGADDISGFAGSDEVYGGDGDDVLRGSEGEEPVAMPGDDELYGEAGADVLVGGSGADVLRGATDADVILDGPENDAAVDDIDGGDGDDEITSANIPASRDTVLCGSGVDTVTADNSDDVDNATCENVSRLMSEEQAATQEATSYASDFSVSVEEAERRLALQDDVGELGARLAANEGTTYAGIESINGPNFRVVAYFTQGGEQTLEPYVQDTPLESVVEVGQVDATLSQLEDAQLEAKAAYDAQGLTVDSDFNVTQNRAEIYVPEAAFASSSSDIQAANFTLPPQAVQIKVDELASPSAFYGGLPLNNYRGGLECTSGFTVKHPYRNLEGTLTAGHCIPYTHKYPMSEAQLFNGGRKLDFQAQDMNGSQDIQWHTTWKRDDRAVFNATSVHMRPVTATRGRGNQEKGHYVCKFGRRTGYACGVIIGKNASPDWVNGEKATFMRARLTKSGPFTYLGDSGGPVFLNTTAYGIVAGGTAYELELAPIGE